MSIIFSLAPLGMPLCFLFPSLPLSFFHLLLSLFFQYSPIFLMLQLLIFCPLVWPQLWLTNQHRQLRLASQVTLPLLCSMLQHFLFHLYPPFLIIAYYEILNLDFVPRLCFVTVTIAHVIGFKRPLLAVSTRISKVHETKG